MPRLIDADAFDKALSDAQVECKRNGGNFRFGVLANVRGNLSKAPSVDAAPVVHAQWELVDEAEPQRYRCSKCSCLSWYGMYNYCPNCGAKMDLEG